MIIVCLVLQVTCSPVGVADRNKIPDAKMSASSYYHGTYHYYPHIGRLYETRGGKGWCPKTKYDRTDYLQVDMGMVHVICAVATQGKGTGGYVASYKLSLSTDGANWNAYKEQNQVKVKKATHTSIVKLFVAVHLSLAKIIIFQVSDHDFNVAIATP